MIKAKTWTLRRPEAVLFDLDGTLTDSAPAIAAALNVVWRDRGRPPAPEAQVRGFIGDGPGVLIARARGAAGLPVDAAAERAETEAFMTAYAVGGPGGVLYPGALETVARIAEAGVPMAVCTNKPQDAAVRLLEALGLMPFLAAVVGGDVPVRRKPDPAHVQAALAAFDGLPPADALMIGDGPQDVASAEAAGVPVLVAAYGYGGAAELRPELPAIGDIRDLPKLLLRQDAGETAPE